MSLDSLYLYIMVAASSCMLITGFILAQVKAPADGRADKFRLTKYILTVAVLILGGLNLLQISYDSGGSINYLSSCIALSVAFLQAMLFTMGLLVLVQPSMVTRSRIFYQLVVILCIECLLIGSFILLPSHQYIYVHALCVVFYLIQLAVYIRWYMHGRKVFLNQIDAYYEEDEIKHSMGWIRFIFWASLTVGFLSLLMIFNERIVDMCLTMALAIFYAMFATCFINYGLSAPIILPAIYQKEEQVTVVPQKVSKAIGKDLLDKWIETKGYLNNDLAVSEIASMTGMTDEEFHHYFREVMGEEFRSWRLRRRIEEAKDLMVKHPEYSTTQVGKMCGFNDRSFFYQQFSRFVGITVGEFRRTALS